MTTLLKNEETTFLLLSFVSNVAKKYTQTKMPPDVVFVTGIANR